MVYDSIMWAIFCAVAPDRIFGGKLCLLYIYHFEF
jgi:hypothetical protein